MENLRAISLMILAMACFALADAGIKQLSGALPLGQIMGTIGLAGTCLFGLAVMQRAEPLWSPGYLHWAVLLRYGAEIFATFFVALSLAHVPLSLVSAIFQAAPLIVTLGAALWFHEPVGWRRWAAVLAGFAGVLILLRPFGTGFELTALLPLMAVTGLAIRDLATRAAPASLTNRQLSFVGFSAIIPAALLLQLIQPPMLLPDARQAGLLALAVGCTLVAYYAVTAAMRLGDISAVSPFRYSRLIFGIGLGIVLFGERPDALTYLGSVIVVASGVYTVLRERRVARDTSRP